MSDSKNNQRMDEVDPNQKTFDEDHDSSLIVNSDEDENSLNKNETRNSMSEDENQDEGVPSFDKFYENSQSFPKRQSVATSLVKDTDYDEDQSLTISRLSRTKNMTQKRASTSNYTDTSGRKDFSPAKQKRVLDEPEIQLDPDQFESFEQSAHAATRGVEDLNLEFRGGYKLNKTGAATKKKGQYSHQDQEYNKGQRTEDAFEKLERISQFGKENNPNLNSPSGSGAGKDQRTSKKFDPKLTRKTTTKPVETGSTKRIRPNENNTVPFELTETNTERVDINYFTNNRQMTEAFNKWCEEGEISQLKSFLMTGKKFSQFVKDCRLDRKKYVEVRGMKINISQDPSEIMVNELTKQRFLALCHYHLYYSTESGNFTSPLCSRIIFTEENPLTLFKSLIGGGLQFLGKIFRDEADTPKEGLLTYHAACIAMDYIMLTSKRVAKNGAIEEAKIDSTKMSFLEYALSPIAADGDMLLAGARNMNDTNLSSISENLEDFFELCSLIKISMFGGNARDRVRSNYRSLVNNDIVQGLMNQMVRE